MGVTEGGEGREWGGRRVEREKDIGRKEEEGWEEGRKSKRNGKTEETEEESEGGECGRPWRVEGTEREVREKEV